MAKKSIAIASAMCRTTAPQMDLVLAAIQQKIIPPIMAKIVSGNGLPKCSIQ